LQRRLSARDDDAVEEVPTIAELVKHLVNGNARPAGCALRQDKIGIVAERAAKVAARDEDDGRDVTVVIGERQRD
jgi:hypothetical protein